MDMNVKISLATIPEGTTDLFGEAKTRDESLHEALCKAIHEQDQEAIEWLTTNVTDIRQQDEKGTDIILQIDTSSTESFLKNAAGIVSDFICNHDEINEVCNKIAMRESKTTEWTREQWEQNENTAQYDLYYAYLSEIHQQILAEAVQMCGYRFEINP